MKCAVSSVSAFKEKCFSCPFVFCSFFDFFPLNFLCNPSYLWSFSVTSSYFPVFFFFFFSTASTYKHMETDILGEKTHKTNQNICYAQELFFFFLIFVLWMFWNFYHKYWAVLLEHRGERVQPVCSGKSPESEAQRPHAHWPATPVSPFLFHPRTDPSEEDENVHDSLSSHTACER